MLRKIYLHNSLNALAPEPIEFDARNCFEVVRFLKIAVPGFWRQFRELDRICFIRKTGEETSVIEREELAWQLGDTEEVHICPVVEGAGAETIGGYLLNMVISMAVSYAVSYILQSMQETPETEDLKPDQSSTIFNGGKTLDRQGGRVPLAYGRCMVNGVRVNINYEAVDAALGQSNSITIGAGETSVFNIFTNDKNLTSPVVVNFSIDGTTTAAGGTYTGFGSEVTVRVLANGQFTLSATLAGGGTSFTVEVYATDNGLSIPQKVYVTIYAPVSDPGSQGGEGGGGEGSGGESGGGESGGGEGIGL